MSSRGDPTPLLRDDFRSGEQHLIAWLSETRGSIARINHQFRVPHDHLVIDVAVVSNYDDGVTRANQFAREADRRQRVAQVPCSKMGHVRIMVADASEAAIELNDYAQGGRFAIILDVTLIGDSEQEDRRVLERFALKIESFGQPINHVFRHRAVNLPGQLDKPRGKAMLPSFPGEIEGVDRYAMTAQSGTRIERRKAEWLGGGSTDHFPYVETYSIEQQLKLIHHRDINAAIYVLEQLGRLGNPRAANRDHNLDDLGIRGTGNFSAMIGQPTHQLGNGLRTIVLVRRVLSFRREGQEKFLAGLEARIGEDWQHNLLGSSRIGRTLQHHQLSGMQELADFAHGTNHEAQVRVTSVVQWSGNANYRSIAGRQLLIAVGGREPTRRDQ